MSESKYTPGPWEVRDRFYVGRPGRFSLATMVCGDIPADDTEQHEANARLIAIAPDMHALITDLSRLSNIGDADYLVGAAKELLNRLHGEQPREGGEG